MIHDRNTNTTHKHETQQTELIPWQSLPKNMWKKLLGANIPHQITTIPKPEFRIFFWRILLLNHTKPSFKVTSAFSPNITTESIQVAALGRGRRSKELWRSFKESRLDEQHKAISQYLEPWNHLCFCWKKTLFWGGLTFKKRGHWGSRYIEICSVHK